MVLLSRNVVFSRNEQNNAIEKENSQQIQVPIFCRYEVISHCGRQILIILQAFIRIMAQRLNNIPLVRDVIGSIVSN